MERIKIYLFLFFIIPFTLSAEIKDDLFTTLAESIECGDFENCQLLLDNWKTCYPNDAVHAEACKSLLLLADNQIDEAILLYTCLQEEIQTSRIIDSNMKESYQKIFHELLNCSTPPLQNEEHSWNQFNCKLKFRGWKIKSFCGAILFTTGLFITPFNPSAGQSIIITAAGLMFDGTLGYMDERDDNDRDRKEPPKALIPIPKNNFLKSP